MLRNLLIIFTLSISFLLNGQNTSVIVAGEVRSVYGYNSNNQDSTIKHSDTTVIVGYNPKYYFKNRFKKWELNYNLPKGTYMLYLLNGKYKKKVHTTGYEIMEKEIAKQKKYKGYLYKIVTFGSDSLKTGISQSFRYDYKTKKEICYGFISYSHGILEGLSVEYYRDGTIRSVGNYNNHKEHGTWFFFGKNPTEVTEIKYDNGKRVATD